MAISQSHISIKISMSHIRFRRILYNTEIKIYEKRFYVYIRTQQFCNIT